MSTLNLRTIRSLIRYQHNDQDNNLLSDYFLNLLINDGYKDVSIKGVSYESRVSKANIYSGSGQVSLSSSNPIRPAFVSYDTGTGEIGLAKIIPQALGHIPTQGDYPQFWFPWGDIIVIDPVPAVATYDLFAYCAIFPTAALTLDTDTPTNLPPEFHECVYMYALAWSNLRLRQWANFVTQYNDYHAELTRRKNEYITKHPDLVTVRALPDVVEITYGETNAGG